LVHRLWTCPVLAPARVRLVPPWLLEEVTGKLSSDGRLPPGEVLVYTRALTKSLEPSVPLQPEQETFVWVKQPPSNHVAGCTVYADGSRLFAETRYANLVARQGWAFATFDADGGLVAAAHGRTPWWAEGIHATELWALLNAVLSTTPGNPFIIDCKAVMMGSRRGQQWATAPNRRLARAWAPLAAALEGSSEAVVWMPAHCREKDVGERVLSNGSLLSCTDLAANAFVDGLAKEAARQEAVQPHVLQMVADASLRVEALARWIGQCTVLANEFPSNCTPSSGKTPKLRDNEGKGSGHRAQRPRRSHKRKPAKPASAVLPPLAARLLQCPRWAALRQRIIDRAKARQMSGEATS